AALDRTPRCTPPVPGPPPELSRGCGPSSCPLLRARQAMGSLRSRGSSSDDPSRPGSCPRTARAGRALPIVGGVAPRATGHGKSENEREHCLTCGVTAYMKAADASRAGPTRSPLASWGLLLRPVGSRRNVIADRREDRLIPLFHHTQLHQHVRECVADQAEPASPIRRSRVTHQPKP